MTKEFRIMSTFLNMDVCTENQYLMSSIFLKINDPPEKKLSPDLLTVSVCRVRRLPLCITKLSPVSRVQFVCMSDGCLKTLIDCDGSCEVVCLGNFTGASYPVCRLCEFVSCLRCVCLSTDLKKICGLYTVTAGRGSVVVCLNECE